jgi:hypothetical protein
VIVGLIQATLGGLIPNWTGNKANPVALGLLTIGLSLISATSAMTLRTTLGLRPGRRLAAALGLLIPGGLCFSTGGALWYVPGAVLLTGGVYAVLAGEGLRTRQVIAASWLHLLLSVLGGLEILMAVSAGPALTIGVGVAGGIALFAAPWPPVVGLRLALLLVGTLPFAILTWWSLAGPIIAVLGLAIGLTTLRRQSAPKERPRNDGQPAAAVLGS